MVYMNGKNNLEYTTVRDINDAESAGSGDKVHMVVECGRIKGNGRNGDSVAQGDWGGVRRYYIEKDSTRRKTNSRIMLNRAAADMGDWHELSEFIRWTKANYPAEKYFLSIWNHGYGWKPVDDANSHAMKPRRVRGISSDDQTGNEISTQDMARALARAGGVDVLAYDACLMQGVETAYEVRKHADFVVGSEAMEPGSIQHYGKLLAYLKDSPRAEAGSTADKWVELYKDFFTSGNAAKRRKKTEGIVVTHSAIKSEKLERFTELLEAWIKLALGHWDGSAMAKGKKKAKAYEDREYKDLVDFVSIVGAAHSSPSVKAAGEELIAFAKEEMISSNWSRSKRSHGMTIYVPRRKYSPLYDTLAFSRQGSWPELARKLAAVDIDLPE